MTVEVRLYMKKSLEVIMTNTEMVESDCDGFVVANE